VKPCKIWQNSGIASRILNKLSTGRADRILEELPESWKSCHNNRRARPTMEELEEPWRASTNLDEQADPGRAR
jgi:hypothetical protein